MAEQYVRYHLRLSKKDAAKLDAAVRKSGLSRAAYIRALINDLIPTDKPPPDYFLMMRNLHSIANNLNQIAQRAHITGDINALRYEKNARELTRINTKIMTAVYEHRKLK